MILGGLLGERADERRPSLSWKSARTGHGTTTEALHDERPSPPRQARAAGEAPKIFAEMVRNRLVTPHSACYFLSLTIPVHEKK
jgi:hypothetical protein